MLGEAKWKPIQQSLSRNSKQPAFLHSWNTATTKDLEDARKVVPSTSAFSSPVRTMQKTDGSWRMVVGYHQLNQVVTVIAAVVPDMVSLLKQINTFF